MKLNCTWNEKMKFTAQSGEHQVSMDARAPIGSDSALSPKQLVVAGICGCTGMDVVALMRKYRQPVQSLEVEAEVSLTEGEHPVVFKEVELRFRVTGQVEREKLMEAVVLSQTQYCGVSAMIAQVAPIRYQVELNGEKIGSGEAQFKLK